MGQSVNSLRFPCFEAPCHASLAKRCVSVSRPWMASQMAGGGMYDPCVNVAASAEAAWSRAG